MRDPERIDRILDRLDAYWKKFPDMRLAQIIVNAALTNNPYNIEDDVVEANIPEVPIEMADPADTYFEAESDLYQHCGVVETWQVYPIVDRREMFWCVAMRELAFSPKKEAVEAYVSDDALDVPAEFNDCFYSSEICTNRELKTGVFRGEKYTMVLEDTNTDGNVWWALFRNENEVKDPESTE